MNSTIIAIALAAVMAAFLFGRASVKPATIVVQPPAEPLELPDALKKAQDEIKADDKLSGAEQLSSFIRLGH